MRGAAQETEVAEAVQLRVLRNGTSCSSEDPVQEPLASRRRTRGRSTDASRADPARRSSHAGCHRHPTSRSRCARDPPATRAARHAAAGHVALRAVAAPRAATAAGEKAKRGQIYLMTKCGRPCIASSLNRSVPFSATGFGHAPGVFGAMFRYTPDAIHGMRPRAARAGARRAPASPPRSHARVHRATTAAGWPAARWVSAPLRNSQRRTGSGRLSVARRSRSSWVNLAALASGAASRNVQRVGAAR